MKILFKLIVIDLAAFVIIHLIHFRVFSPRIIFLAGLFDVVMAVAVGSLCGWILLRDSTLVMAAGLVCLSTCMLYVTLIPTMVDRSITVYTLLSLRDAGKKGVSEDVISERLRSNRIIEKRFEELKATGAIDDQSGQLSLTGKGYLSATVFEWSMRTLHLDREYRMFQKAEKK